VHPQGVSAPKRARADIFYWAGEGTCVNLGVLECILYSEYYDTKEVVSNWGKNRVLPPQQQSWLRLWSWARKHDDGDVDDDDVDDDDDDDDDFSSHRRIVYNCANLVSLTAGHCTTALLTLNVICSTPSAPLVNDISCVECDAELYPLIINHSVSYSRCRSPFHLVVFRSWVID